MSKLIKKNGWDFNKIFESVTGVKPSTDGNTSNKPVPDITDIDGVKMPIAPSTLSGDFNESKIVEGDLEYSHVDDASPESDSYVIQEGSNRKKVLAKHLKVGDIIIGLGQGLEVVQAPTAGISTPSGKVELVVKYPDGKLYQKVWNGNTVIGVVDNTPLDNPLTDGSNGMTDGITQVNTGISEMFGDVNSNMDTTVGLGESKSRWNFNKLFESVTGVKPMLNEDSNVAISNGQLNNIIEGKGLNEILSRFEETVINEIDFDGEFGDVKAQCIAPRAIVEWLNDEMKRLETNRNLPALKKAAKADPTLPKPEYKNRKDRGRPEDTIITGGNIEATKDESGNVNIDKFIENLTMEPDSIFDANPKMEKSDYGRPQLSVNTGLPAIVAIVYDQDNKKFYAIQTCPSAGECKVGCYARKAFYGMDDSKTMKLARRVNLLLNNPTKYQERIMAELEPIAADLKRSSIGKEPIQLVIRWHDAGDFFSDRYFKIAVDTTKALLDKGYFVKSYAYTKRSKYVIELDGNNNFVVNFSTDAHKADRDAIDNYANKDNLKLSHRVPEELFHKKGFFVYKGPHYVKGSDGLPLWADESQPDRLKQLIFDTFGSQFKFTLDSLKYTWELPRMEQTDNKIYNLIILPTGDSDIGAQRKDVRISFLLEH